jgi:hypothetical protein
VATPLLETTLNKFPQGTDDFVSHSVLKDYIQDTATKTEVDAITKYNTEVQNVVKTDDKWAVQTAYLHTTDSGALSQEISTDVSVIHYSQTHPPNTHPELRRRDSSIRPLPRPASPRHPRPRRLEAAVPRSNPALERVPLAQRLPGQGNIPTNTSLRASKRTNTTPRTSS